MKQRETLECDHCSTLPITTEEEEAEILRRKIHRPDPRKQLRTAWEWYALGTVLLSFANTIAYSLVIIQRYYPEEGTSRFLPFLLAPFMLFYTFDFVDGAMRTTIGFDVYHPSQLILTFPLAILVPSVNLMLHRLDPCQRPPKVFTPVVDQNAVQALTEECEVVERDLVFTEWFADQKEIHHGGNARVCFQYESVLIFGLQLIAIHSSGGQNLTWLEVCSVLLNVAYLTCWVPIVGWSFTANVMLFKALLLAHDLLNLAYEAASISRNDCLTFMLRNRVYGVAAFGTLAIALLFVRHPPKTRRDVGVYLGAIVALVAAEITMLGLLLVLIVSNEPKNASGIPGYLLVHSFVQRGDREERLRFVTAPERLGRPPCRPIAHTVPTRREIVHQRKRCLVAAVTGDLKRRSTKAMGKALIWAGLPYYAASQLYGVLYPFINYGLHFSEQSPLQHCCAAALSLVVVSLLVLLPSAYEYTWFCVEVSAINATRLPIDCVKSSITAYHLPSIADAAIDVVPVDVLPLDVVGEVAEFLPAAALNLRHLTVSECQHIKRRTRDRTVLASDVEEVLLDVLSRGSNS